MFNDAITAAIAVARPRRREKLFGDGRPVPLDRNGKVRVMTLARALTRRTEPGKHWGELTAKALDVLQALLWGFHNARSGLCFPSYETIADKAGCARSTVAAAILSLEKAGLLTWCNRIARVRIAGVVRVIRISNGYRFRDPLPCRSSKSELKPGTRIQDVSLLSVGPKRPLAEPESQLELALMRLGRAIGRA